MCRAGRSRSARYTYIHTLRIFHACGYRQGPDRQGPDRQCADRQGPDIQGPDRHGHTDRVQIDSVPTGSGNTGYTLRISHVYGYRKD